MIRLFSLCQAMKWNHLPEPGGIYNQNPDLLDYFEIIFTAQAKEDERREAERKAKDEAKQSRLGSRPRRGGVRHRR